MDLKNLDILEFFKYDDALCDCLEKYPLPVTQNLIDSLKEETWKYINSLSKKGRLKHTIDQVEVYYSENAKLMTNETQQAILLTGESDQYLSWLQNTDFPFIVTFYKGQFVPISDQGVNND